MPPKAAKSKTAAKQTKSTGSYALKDVVLGKVRGYPPWPGWIVDPDDAPRKVKDERPGKGGSSTAANFSLVQFFPTGDYAWLTPKDISRLQKHEVESYINDPVKKSGDLLSGYRIALNPS
ncbi:Tudor/PWWP/MBT, partial [Cylindrobasidium torrendii FP15055 ss-10]